MKKDDLVKAVLIIEKIKTIMQTAQKRMHDHQNNMTKKKILTTK